MSSPVPVIDRPAGTEAWMRAAAAFMDEMVAADERTVESPVFDIRVWNKFYDLEGYCADYTSATVEFARNRVGTGQIIVPGDSEFGPIFMRCTREVVPVTVEYHGKRWSGRVDTCERKWDKNGITYTATLVSDWAWLQSILCWPSPFAPLQAQFPKSMITLGPSVTCIKSYLLANLLRLQIPLWSIINNISLGGLISSIGAGFTPGYYQNIDPEQPNNPVQWTDPIVNRAQWPVAVKPADPLHDTSKWTAMTARMVDAETLFADVLKDEGLMLTADLFIPGEDEPIPGLNLTRPTVVLDVVDLSGFVGETGTAIDGLKRSIVEFGSNGTKVIRPYTGPDSEAYKQPGFFGQDYTQPWVTFWEGEHSGISESKVTAHHPIARYVVVGGRSPGWLNKGINLLIESALSAILAFVGLSGIAPTILNGILDDVFLAFDRYEDRRRTEDVGPYGFYEYYAPGGAVAYSLSGIIAGLSGIHDTRGYESYQFSIDDRAPYQFGVHMDIGQPIAVESAGLLYLQYLESAQITDSRTERVHTKLAIGDPSAEEDPTAKMARKLKRLGAFANAIFLNN
ncbi:gp36 protein [Mycobacteroides abscessus subsp. abscessus]|nr:gp36 protein [Mycobacteroides abscessus subsp. abscessus]